MRAALGERGATLIAAGIAISTIGFLSQNLLTGPRVYFAMATDGTFFKSVATVHPRTRVPVVAIVLQGAIASLLALSGSYERILGFVVAIDWLFFGLTALALVVMRRRDAGGGDGRLSCAGPSLHDAGVRRRGVAHRRQYRLSLSHRRACRPRPAGRGRAGLPVWQRRGARP